MVTKPIEIKEQVFLKEYKNIIRTCIKEGDILPSLLDVVDVPEKYDFTPQEISKIKISKESSESRQNKIIELEEKLSNVHYNGNLKELDDELNTIFNEELMGWIGRHSEFQKILK